MRRKSLAQRLILFEAVLTATIGATTTPAHAETTLGWITGKLTTSDGTPVGSATVTANGPSWRSATTAADGVFPPNGSSYGAQWVGANGGTGDQREAAIIKVTDGQRTTGPTVRLDQGGTITGTVTSETGQQLNHGFVGLLTASSSLGGGTGAHFHIGDDGRSPLPGSGRMSGH
jgi:hypothetical protein